MKKKLSIKLYFLVVLSFMIKISPGYAQIYVDKINDPNLNQTVGLFLKKNTAFNGYTLFAPLRSGTTYLIDIDGRLVQSWSSDFTPGSSVYLLENGNLLRTATENNQAFTAGGEGGRIQEFSWDGTLVWNFIYSNDRHTQHHDIEKLPNGNVLVIAWELKTAVEAVASGRNPTLLIENELWPDHVVEIEPTGLNDGNIVWEWHFWDHLVQDFDSTKANYGVVADHPELFDINFVTNKGPNRDKADINHINAIDYNAELDQILISGHAASEIYIIDHSTSTEEAAGHTGGFYGKGGDLLYRWGNPAAYRAGNSENQKLYRQHDSYWINNNSPGSGNIMVFNNGRNRPDGSYSSIDVINPPVDSSGNYLIIPGSSYGPTEPEWTYTAPTRIDFYSQNQSGAQRLPNGNTLICSGANGRFFEVTPDREIVWEYINPVTENGPLYQGDPVALGINNDKFLNPVFRAYRYSADFPGLAGKDLTPGDPVELYVPSSIRDSFSSSLKKFTLMQNYPNPFNPETKIVYILQNPQKVSLRIYNTKGQLIRTLINAELAAGKYSAIWDGLNKSGLPATSGLYFFRLDAGSDSLTRRMILMR